MNTPIHVDDGINEYESVLKRQKSITSKVYDEMTKLECENKVYYFKVSKTKESLAFGKLSRRGIRTMNMKLAKAGICQNTKVRGTGRSVLNTTYVEGRGISFEECVVIDNEVAKKVGKSAKGHFEKNVCRNCMIGEIRQRFTKKGESPLELSNEEVRQRQSK
ncbi:hypothetical protein Gogos_006188 [Gossypium gossypioides]|uniref:Uncharacterized protein n=1 Tax=Gossypium gossypioides TaxID=34282 RepID=A0A7J9C4W2_GOSGO|nr:hypothetical protein [Gossypium gossypioides]